MDLTVFPRTIVVVLLLVLAGFGSSDLAQDRAECTDKLIGLATCLPYVGGDAKAPTQDCCNGLKPVLDKSKKCLCVLIKDRDDPSLGLKINATLAVHLPTACHNHANISECVELLHLAPNSPEAKVFEGLAKAENNSSTPAFSANSTGSSGSVSNSNVKNGGGWGKSWMVSEVVREIIPLLFIFNLFFIL